MTRALPIIVLVLGIATPAFAQSGWTETPRGLGRALGTPQPTAPEPSETPAGDTEPGDSEEGDEEDGPWAGPQIELAYGYLKLADGYGGGDAHFAHFEVFIQLPVSEFRLGLGAALGNRDYSLGGDDLMVRGFVEVGFQLTEIIDPLVPYISFVGTGGGLVGERFETTVTHALGGAGFEVGAALRVYRNFHFTAAFSYQRWEMDGAAFDIAMLRLGLGL